MNDDDNQLGMNLKTQIGDFLVSTIELPMAPIYGIPTLRETVVFKNGEVLEDSLIRYDTKAQAIAGHEAACKKIKEEDHELTPT